MTAQDVDVGGPALAVKLIFPRRAEGSAFRGRGQSSRAPKRNSLPLPVRKGRPCPQRDSDEETQQLKRGATLPKLLGVK